jgi:hypothetical protein
VPTTKVIVLGNLLIGTTVHTEGDTLDLPESKVCEYLANDAVELAPGQSLTARGEIYLESLKHLHGQLPVY